jgi:transposase-like protein
MVKVKLNDQTQTIVANPEVTTKASRRRFTREYKRKILAEVEQGIDGSEVGALLRREGLYDSHLSRWRKARREGELVAARQHQRTSVKVKALKQEVAEVQAENQRLQKALFQAELVIDVQKKLSQVLGLATMKANE